jgi:hypothetical protein
MEIISLTDHVRNEDELHRVGGGGGGGRKKNILHTKQKDGRITGFVISWVKTAF